MAFYFEVRADSTASFAGEWSLIKHYIYPEFVLYRSKGYELISDMLKDAKAFIEREKVALIPIFLKDGFLLEDSDERFCDVMDDSLPCGCPSIEVCERGGV